MRRMILTGSLMLALSATAMAGQVYKWVDENGNTHFGAQPPEGREATTINTNVPQPKAAPAKPVATPSEEDAEQEAVDKKVKQDVAKAEAERKAYCEQTRANLAQLKNNPRLKIHEGDEVKRMTEEERQAKIAEAEKNISEDCR